MLDLFTIFSKGGIVLYSNNLRSSRLTAIDELISEVFADSRHGENHTTINNQKFQWIFENELELIFVIAYQKILQLPYIEELLNNLKDAFCNRYQGDIKAFFHNQNTVKEFAAVSFPEFDFESKFNSILKAVEKVHTHKNKNKAPRRFEDTKKYQSTLEGSKKNSKDKQESEEEQGMSTPEVISPVLKAKTFKGKAKGKKGSKDKQDDYASTGNEDKKKRIPRTWEGQVNKTKMEALDYSEAKSSNDVELVNNLVNDDEKGEYNADGTYDVKDIDGAEEEDYEYIEQFTKPKEESESRFMSIFKSLTGQHVINEEELLPVLTNMKEHLVQKNVASEIAEHLCESVKNDVVGKKLGSFQSLAKAVSNSLRESITQILTPNTSMDIIKEINLANSNNRPYVMAFIGVNGVGKSTNLSKTCFWLLQNRKKVLVAACDTFRSGAVEQLRVHVNNLLKLNKDAQVQLYERGYGKDSANIAKDAIAFATSNGFDVVLIDTAGRMQNNESLMKALARLVAVNDPDKVIFVGEALVGNEAVDQLSKFNQVLVDYSGSSQPHKIDGIILTKFDTIDDKVGAALSMTFTSRAPILFVGTGQTYTDLKKMNVDHVVNALLKK